MRYILLLCLLICYFKSKRKLEISFLSLSSFEIIYFICQVIKKIININILYNFKLEVIVELGIIFFFTLCMYSIIADYMKRTF